MASGPNHVRASPGARRIMTQSKSTIKNDWQTVWSKKSPDENGSDLLSSLIKADGFDSGFSFYTPNDWLLMVEDAAERTHVLRESQVLEIGCGSGAFLDRKSV